MHPLPTATVVPVVGGLASSVEEQQARTAKRDHARRRFEHRNARLRREEEQRLAARLARTQRASQAQTQSVDPVQAALQRVRAKKADQPNATLKKAKVDLSMSRQHQKNTLQATR